jgi:AraC family transcriptional regulator
MSKAQLKDSPIAQLAEPRFVDGKALLIAGQRAYYTTDNTKEIVAQWRRFAPHIGKLPGQPGRAAYGVCWHTSDGEGIEYLSGVEVAGFADLPGEFSVVSIPALKYAVFPHRGHVLRMPETIAAIFYEWLPKSGYEAGDGVSETPDFLERYNEEFNPGTGAGGMEVWVPIKP